MPSTQVTIVLSVPMTQTALVLHRLREAGPAGVTAYQLLTRDGIYRAGARVYDLRRLGYQIETENRKGLTARYRLIETVQLAAGL